MTISWQVQQQIIAAQSSTADPHFFVPMGVFNTTTSPAHTSTTRAHRRASHWTDEEHERFLQGLELFPSGPWKEVAAVVGTKTTRQTMTHAQKYRQKMERRIKLAKNLQVMAKEAASNEREILYCEPLDDLKASYSRLLSPSAPTNPPLDSPLDVSTDLGDYDFLIDFVDLLGPS